MLVINPSPYVSSLCYSIFRIEPYTSCSFNCRYCYGRWYSWKGGLKDVYTFEKISKRIHKDRLKTIPFRLSTLSDPFQYSEVDKRFSLRVLRIALKYSIPLIINTKSTLLMNEPWRNIIVRLGDKGLLVLQVTLITLDEKVSRELEPYAPSPEERLKLIEYFSSERIPVVVRLQPYIPGIFRDEGEIEEYFKMLKSTGVIHVIVESLRCIKSDLEYYGKLLNTDAYQEDAWDIYPIRGGSIEVVKPRFNWLYREYIALRKYAEKYGISFATCKEGFFSLHTAPDCCGMFFLEDYVLRPTLYEAWLMYRRDRRVPSIDELLSEYCTQGNYICSIRLVDYPRVIRKGIRNHEKMLGKVLCDRELLGKVAFEFTYV